MATRIRDGALALLLLVSPAEARAERAASPGLDAAAAEDRREAEGAAEARGAAGTVAPRSLEALGRDAEAYDAFLESLARRPEDEATWRGLWRTAPTARPNLVVRFRDYDSRVLEGRGRAEVDPIEARYSGFRLTEEATIPIDDHLVWTIESEQFEDELESRTAGLTIYDVFGFSAMTGVEAQPARDWSVAAGAGGAAFESRTDEPIDPEQMPLARAMVRWRPSAQGLAIEVGYRRGYLFGRSLGGELGFAIFAEDRFSLRVDKALGGPFSWRGAASYLRYDDGSEPTLASTGIVFEQSPVAVIVYGDHSPIQSYFLKPGDRLDFVEVTTLGTRGEIDVLSWLETRGGLRASWYADSNDELFAWGESVVHDLWVPFLRVGLRYEARDFRRTSSLYSSYDYDQWGPVVGVGGTIVPWLDFDVEYGHGFRDERFVSSFDEDAVRWSFELFVNPALRVGTDGEWSEDDLPQRRRRIGAFAQAVF